MVYKLYLNTAVKKLSQILNTHLTSKCFYHTDTQFQHQCIASFGDKVKSCHLKLFGTVEAGAQWPFVHRFPTPNQGKKASSGQGGLDAERQESRPCFLGGVNCFEGLVHKNVRQMGHKKRQVRDTQIFTFILGCG